MSDTYSESSGRDIVFAQCLPDHHERPFELPVWRLRLAQEPLVEVVIAHGANLGIKTNHHRADRISTGTSG
jgi:hypothetical protein